MSGKLLEAVEAIDEYVTRMQPAIFCDPIRQHLATIRAEAERLESENRRSAGVLAARVGEWIP